ncbi:MAG TPA: hydroxyisourate hydrolase [Polyangiales bacterium]|nr:hydroxyisourate hydrolase [Polyangiales bacterium]
MSPITSHVLDTALGKPAVGLALRLQRQAADGWQTLAERSTNQDGRAPDLLAPGTLVRGTYRMIFDTGSYLRATGQAVFYPQVEIVFAIEAETEHYHIPLLLSPFGYTTYRGS